MSDGTRLDEEHDLASPDALYARATDGGFRLVVIGARKPGENGQLLSQLARDSRFTLFRNCHMGQDAWGFVVSAPAPATGCPPL